MKILKVRCKGKYLDVMLDEGDYEKFSRWKWEYSGDRVQRGARHMGRRVHVCLAREIKHCPKGLEVDHIDRNRLNNQKNNLRICTRSQNQINNPPRGASGFKGVSARGSKWAAYIKVTGKMLYLGIFKTSVEAAAAYNFAARKHFGEFAWLNPVD